MNKKKTERVTITATYFMESFKNLPPDMRFFVASFFSMDEEKAVPAINDFIDGILADNPASEARDGAVEGLEHLRSAWLKMTKGERFWLRHKLNDPKFIKKYFSNKDIIESSKSLGINHEE